MVAKSKAGTAAEIKKKIAAARTESDRRALVFELKKAEKAEKAKSAAKATTKTKAKPKPRAKAKAETESKVSAKKPAAKSTSKPVAQKPKAAGSSKTIAKPTVSKKPKVVASKPKPTSLKKEVAPAKAKAAKASSHTKTTSKPKVTAVKTTVKKKVAAKAAPEQKQAVVENLNGGANSVLSVEEVNRQLAAITQRPSLEELESLVDGDPFVTIENLHAGYGKLEILQNFNLSVGRKQSLCLIGPKGAGKSTVLHAVFGFNNIFSGTIKAGDGSEKRDITELSPNQKLSDAGIAYILQDKSILLGMTVEENLWLGGFLKDKPAEAKRATEQVFDTYPRLAKRRKRLAKTLSSGERRLVEICRALIMDPQVLLVDEPSLGLKQRSVDMVYEFLHDLQHKAGKTIIMVEQNAKKGLEFADIGYVMVNGEVAIADTSESLLANAKIRELFLSE